MHVMKNAFELFSGFEDSAQEEKWSSNMCCSLCAVALDQA
jgi:hypothetical protein